MKYRKIKRLQQVKYLLNGLILVFNLAVSNNLQLNKRFLQLICQLHQ